MKKVAGKGSYVGKRLTHSEEVRLAYEARRVRPALVVEGITGPLGDKDRLEASEMSEINVDQRAYQRHRTSEVQELIHVIKNGGAIYGRISIAIRPDGTKWLVDGLQRFSAAFDCGVSLSVDYYKSTGPAAEALLYQALNNRRNLTADNIVKSHQGPGAALLRECAADPSHALYTLVSLGDQGKRPYGGFIIVRGMVACAVGLVGTGKAKDVCARLDYAARNDGLALERCRSFLRLIPLVFLPAHPPKVLPMIGLGLVAFKRWRPGPTIPAPRVYMSLRRINWDSHFTSSAIRFLPSVESAISKRWPEK